MRYTRFIKHNHTCWDKFADRTDFQSLLNELSTDDQLSHGRIVELSKLTGVPRNTLKTWRRKVKADKTYKPKHGRKIVTLALPPEVVDRFVEHVIETYVEPQRYLPPQCFAALARQKAREAGHEDFRGSNSWVSRTIDVNGLSFRKPHVQRRTLPDDGWIASFTAHVDAAVMQYPKNLIFNGDETFWRICNGNLKTIARKGADSVSIQTDFDLKQGLTVMVTVSMDGDVLPPLVIVKGETAKAEKRFRDDPRLRHFVQTKRLMIDHSSNGWMNEHLALSYLNFISETVQGRHFFLIWDVHSSHRTDKVKKRAEELGVGMAFVPAGQTSRWQPLDNKIFGALKQRAHTRFNELAVARTTVDIIDALVILLGTLGTFDKDDIRKAWSIFD